MASVRWLEDFGVRTAGSVAERNAAEAIAGRLRALGYASTITPVTLDNGRTSVNVHALSRGSSKRTIVLGAHIDSKAPSPGANDNATGVAAVLEIARLLAAKPAVASVEFVFFGAEETIDKNPDHHHYGSRAYVASMSGSERANTAGMVSVDMIGYGPDFVVRSMERGPQSLVRLMLARSKSSGAGLTYLKDPGKTGWSDHEAFELAGIPAAWIEWRDDPVYHTARDTSAHVKSARVAAAGGLVLELVRSLTEKDLEDLVRR